MIRIEKLQKAFAARMLFADASYHFPPGERVALVGANGAGKTTLLNVLSGLDTADSGDILIPGNTRVGYLPQKPNPHPLPNVLDECQAGARHIATLKSTMDAAVATLDAAGAAGDPAALAAYERAEAAFRLAGGYALEARATAILRGLGFAAADLAKAPQALSGGWRMRLELARLFLSEPQFLILDEPTNHLDLPSLVWVETYLIQFRGTLLFVSHDRALLNRLATITLHLFNGKLTAYRGNFDAFLEAREQRALQEQAQADQLRSRREDMEKFVTRFGAKASKATQAQSRMKMIERIRAVEATLGGDGQEDSVFIDIPAPPKTPRVVFTVASGVIGYERPLATGIKLAVERGHRIAIIGANGIGKSTLLRTIAGRLPPLGGDFAAGLGVEIAYFAQDQTETLDQEQTVLANLLRASTLSEKEARTLLGGFLFRGNDVFKVAKVLSGGELSRLGLACALSKRAGCLLLDEPTNHLDMASVESLAASLESYDGTALFVSHDRTFIDAVCSHVFAMLPDGRSMLFEGKLADYARLAALAGFPNVLEAAVEEGDAKKPAAASKPDALRSHADVKELKRQKQRLQTRLAQVERDMSKHRDLAAQLEAAMAGAHDYAAAAKLHEQFTAANAANAAAETAWLETSEELEILQGELEALGRD